MLDLMYITKNPDVAQIAEKAGVDWIFVDMEFLGKELRQGGLDTVQNHHTVEDVANIKTALSSAKVLVRVNPLHDTIEGYPSSKDEIGSVIDAGADIVMLPFFKKNFLEITWVASAFRGIKAAVAFLIFGAGWKMLKKMKKTPLNLVIFFAALLVMMGANFALYSVSSIYLIIISAVIGLVLYALSAVREGGKKK